MFGLVGLSIGAAMLRGPARGADDTPSSAATVESVPPQHTELLKSVAVLTSATAGTAWP